MSSPESQTLKSFLQGLICIVTILLVRNASAGNEQSCRVETGERRERQFVAQVLAGKTSGTMEPAGSAVLIGRTRTNRLVFATAAHVVACPLTRGANEFEAVLHQFDDNGDLSTERFKLAFAPASELRDVCDEIKQDFALLATQSAGFAQPAAISLLRPTSHIRLGGFPLYDGQGNRRPGGSVDYQWTTTADGPLSDEQGDQYLLTGVARVTNGHSGGAAIDTTNGRVIGVMTKADPKAVWLQSKGENAWVTEVTVRRFAQTLTSETYLAAIESVTTLCNALEVTTPASMDANPWQFVPESFKDCLAPELVAFMDIATYAAPETRAKPDRARKELSTVAPAVAALSTADFGLMQLVGLMHQSKRIAAQLGSAKAIRAMHMLMREVPVCSGHSIAITEELMRRVGYTTATLENALITANAVLKLASSHQASEARRSAASDAVRLFQQIVQGSQSAHLDPEALAQARRGLELSRELVTSIERERGDGG